MLHGFIQLNCNQQIVAENSKNGQSASGYHAPLLTKSALAVM